MKDLAGLANLKELLLPGTSEMNAGAAELIGRLPDCSVGPIHYNRIPWPSL